MDSWDEMRVRGCECERCRNKEKEGVKRKKQKRGGRGGGNMGE